MVAASGAIPVYRPREHGDKAQEYNEAMYRDAFSSLHRGHCLAIAPEGVSRFAAPLAKPFKTGPARIALQAVELMRERDPGFQVHVVPVGITYTHREKFRSDALLDVGEPIVVGADDLAPASVVDAEERAAFLRERARGLTDAMLRALQRLTVDAPDFETLRLGLTATRIFLPLGTRLTLKEHVAVLREWVRVLSPVQAEGADPTFLDHATPQLRAALHDYQALLDEKRVKDERVRRYAFGEERPSRAPLLVLVGFRVLVCAVMWLAAAPGLALWGPVWLAIKYREPKVLANGRTWVDSVAEMKLVTGFVGCIVIGLLSRSWAPRSVVLLWLTLRAYEEAVASTRSLYSHFKFYYLFPASLARMLAMRRQALDLLRAVAARAENASVMVPGVVADGAVPDPHAKSSVIRSWPWQNVSLMRRNRKDWNEILRFHDYNTGDYF